MKTDKIKQEEIITFETFRKPGSYTIAEMKRDEPTCFNSDVFVVKYRITIEKIEEPKEVYEERLTKLWRECDNHHHYYPIMGTAKKMGIELNAEDFGKDRKRK